MRANIIKTAGLLLFTLILVESASFAAGKILAGKGFMYAPVQATPEYDQYLALRDPLLGWPSLDKYGKDEFDISGSRLVPAYPDPAANTSCVAAFGDSFTWGDEVAPEHSYPNYLSEQLRCRVANYGVPGYGTDQAFLRYRDKINDPAKVVILGYYSDNIIRHVNQYRFLIGGHPFNFKPRFVLDGNGALQIIPPPRPSHGEFSRLDKYRAAVPKEYFAPRGAAGVPVFKFPYTASALEMFSHYRIIARLRGYPSYMPFYDENHSSGAFPVTVAIIKAFAAEAKSRGQAPLFLTIPDNKDIDYLHKHGKLPYANLLAAMESAGITTIDTSSTLLDWLLESGERSKCDLYVNCIGHLTPQGNKLVAEQVARQATVQAAIGGTQEIRLAAN